MDHDARKNDFIALKHLHSLIHTSVLHSNKSIINKFATCKDSEFWLVSEAKQIGLGLTCSDSTKKALFICLMPCGHLLGKD